MRILLVASFPDSILDFRGALIMSMLSKGVEVNIAAPDLPVGSTVRDSLEAKGVIVHGIPLGRTGTNPISDLKLLWHLYFLNRRITPDVFLGYTAKPVIYGSLSAWLARVPRRFALITGLGHAFSDSRGGILTTILQRLYGFALGKVDKVFFQNPDDQALFLKLGVLSARTQSRVVNGSGVDLDAYSVEPQPTGQTRFLMIARLLGSKGVREYARAARQIRNLHPDVQFGLVGWIDENPDSISDTELDAFISDESVKFFGRLQDVRPAISKCNVFVLPSYREGTPRTVLEAMAMGRAIITTNSPGCRETVIDGENGFLVSVKSVSELRNVMLKFIDEPELATKMGRRSREIAIEKFDVNKVNAVMLSEMEIL